MRRSTRPANHGAAQQLPAHLQARHANGFLLQQLQHVAVAHLRVHPPRGFLLGLLLRGRGW